MSKLIVPCKTGDVSDGYHTFDELYEHRTVLFVALMKSHTELSWISYQHDDGSEMDDWFIAGMSLPTGDVTYHLPNEYWDSCIVGGIKVLEHAVVWDGHDSNDVLLRLGSWLLTK